MVSSIKHPCGPEEGCCMLIYFFWLTRQWNLILITNFLMGAYCFCSSLLVAFGGFHSCSHFTVVLQIPKSRVPSVHLHPHLFTAPTPDRCRYSVFCVTFNPKPTPLTDGMLLPEGCAPEVRKMCWRIRCAVADCQRFLPALKACSMKLPPDCLPKGICVYLNITQIRKEVVLSLGFCYVPSKSNLFIIGNPSEQRLCLSQSVLVLQPGIAGICIGFL